MLRMVNPGGGFTFVHESRLDEYEARGFTLAPPPEPKPVVGFTAPKPAPKKRKPKKEG